MAVEKIQTGKTPQTNDHASNKGHAALAWHHFFRSLSEEKGSDPRRALQRSVQE